MFENSKKSVVLKLKPPRGEKHGLSMEEKLRRDLRQALVSNEPPKAENELARSSSLTVPDFGHDFDKERKKWKMREIDFD